MNAPEIGTWPGLNAATEHWLRGVAGGRIERVTPLAGGGQRKTFFVTANIDGDVAEQVLQVHVGGPFHGKGITSLMREAKLFEALRKTHAGSLVPRLVAVDAENAILTERAPGSSDFDDLQDSALRKRITKSFVGALARLHTCDATALETVGFAPLIGPKAAALARLALWERFFSHVQRPAPLVRYALRWLKGHAPEDSGAPVICHGDLGPGNFLFDGDNVTKLVDWELAHFGDYHDDLGNLALRGCDLSSMGDLSQMLSDYQSLSGRPVDGWKVRYYRAVTLLMGTITSLVQLDRAVAANADGEPGALIAMPLYLHLVPLLQLWLAEALFDLSGLPREHVELPQKRTDIGALDVALALEEASGALATIQTGGAHAQFGDIVAHLKASAFYGAAIEQNEMDDLSGILGTRPDDVPSGRAALDRRLQVGNIEDDKLLNWSWRSATRQSLLWPAWAEKFAHRLTPITNVAP